MQKTRTCINTMHVRTDQFVCLAVGTDLANISSISDTPLPFTNITGKLNQYSNLCASLLKKFL